MLYLLDTNAISDYANRRPAVLRRVAMIRDDDAIEASVVAVGETWFGVVNMPAGRKRAELTDRVRVAFGDFEWRPVPAEAGPIYGGLKFDCKARGVTPSDNDLWIASTALHLDATVVTRDGDFLKVARLTPKLRVENWAE